MSVSPVPRTGSWSPTPAAVERAEADLSEARSLAPPTRPVRARPTQRDDCPTLMWRIRCPQCDEGFVARRELDDHYCEGTE